MHCPQCETELPETAKFCLECGTQLPVHREAPCVRCSTMLPAGARFCLECGAEQRPPAPPAPESPPRPAPRLPRWEEMTVLVTFEGKQFRNLQHRSDAAEAANRVIEGELRLARKNGWEPLGPTDFKSLLRMETVRALKERSIIGRTTYTLVSVSIPMRRPREVAAGPAETPV